MACQQRLWHGFKKYQFPKWLLHTSAVYKSSKLCIIQLNKLLTSTGSVFYQFIMSKSKHFENRTFLKIFMLTFLQISHLDLDPDPGGGTQMLEDPNPGKWCGLPGSGRIRIRMFLGLLAPDPLVRDTDPEQAPDPDPSIIMQNSKKKKQKKFIFFKLVFCWCLEGYRGTDENSRIGSESGFISQRHGSADPDPYTKMSWIRNTPVLPGSGRIRCRCRSREPRQ